MGPGMWHFIDIFFLVSKGPSQNTRVKSTLSEVPITLHSILEMASGVLASFEILNVEAM